MNRIIFCNFLRRKAEGMDFQIYPGKIGKRIYNEISQEAWEHWTKKQTILINEKKLKLINLEDRKILENEMIKFLFK
ncbi:oxidative damage protection protein [Pantoea sp. SoEX]|uniref:oxidative damage protection protein n=1 Tax=Pantoea sp. SoEX TaxID=2576763 RepID=UPI001358FE75|nr:oxidative damage protection protein [Pantoea sp. SoEX]MXP51305.1 oxidative damage protection protein [Pantoea sp. SoEX]